MCSFGSAFSGTSVFDWASSTNTNTTRPVSVGTVKKSIDTSVAT